MGSTARSPLKPLVTSPRTLGFILLCAPTLFLSVASHPLTVSETPWFPASLPLPHFCWVCRQRAPLVPPCSMGGSVPRTAYLCHPRPTFEITPRPLASSEEGDRWEVLPLPYPLPWRGSPQFCFQAPSSPTIPRPQFPHLLYWRW